MVNSGIVDLVVGVLFVFLVFSLVVSGINEGITRLLAWRSRHLWRALRELVDGEELALTHDPRPRKDEPTAESWAARLHAHPLIRQLEGRMVKRSRLGYIPATDFSRALVDLLVPGGDGLITVERVRERAVSLADESPIKAPLLAIVSECGDRVDGLIRGIADWFDARMEALSRSYRLHVKWALVGIGLVVALVFNVDAIGAAERLYRDETLRAAVADQAATVVSECQGEADLPACTRERVARVDAAIRLPVGWPDADGIDAVQFLGWLIAGIALGQGAPFWFDLLRKTSRMRT